MVDFGIGQISGGRVVGQLADIQIQSLVDWDLVCTSFAGIFCRQAPEENGQRFRLTIAGGKTAPLYVFHGFLLRQLRERFQNLGLVRPVIAHQHGADVAVINLLESGADFDAIHTTDDIFDADHGVIHQLFVDPLIHRFLEFTSQSHVEELNQRFDSSALDENGEENHRYGGGDEERLFGHFILVDEEDQGEGHGTAQSAIRHDEFLHAIQLLQPESIGDISQHNAADDSEDTTE